MIFPVKWTQNKTVLDNMSQTELPSSIKHPRDLFNFGPSRGTGVIEGGAYFKFWLKGEGLYRERGLN